jgi:hypothetical protein
MAGETGMEAPWSFYRRKGFSEIGFSEMRPYVPGEDMAGISISEADKALPTLVGGMIARNPANYADQWYVAKDYFEANFERV